MPIVFSTESAGTPQSYQDVFQILQSLHSALAMQFTPSPFPISALVESTGSVGVWHYMPSENVPMKSSETLRAYLS